KEKPSLILAAGDMIQGNTWANLFQGKPAIEVMNAIGFHAMVVGNHEFDFGQEVLKERIREAKFPVLGANVLGLPAFIKPYVIKEINGLKVAIIGIVTEDTPTSTHPDNVSGLNFLPVSDTVDKYVKEVRDKVDIVIVLTHIGYNADMMLANNVKGIDVIVGGHSHTKTDKHLLVGNTIIVQSWEHGLALGVLDLKIRDGKIVEADGRLEEIKPASMSKKDDVALIVEKYSAQMNALMKQAIGEALIDLDGKNVRIKETNLGNFFADMMRNESGAEAAIINGGGLRTSIKKGTITMHDVYSVLPFNNYIVSIKLSGKQIRETLEYGVSAVELKEGRFPQVSGISFTYAPTGKSGSRVDSIRVNNEPLEPDKIYVVATNDFLAAGGDGYQTFREAIKASGDFSTTGGVMKASAIVYNNAGKWLRDIAVQYVTTRQKINPAVEGRIREVSCDATFCK
ncbi:MAG: multifunctional 2',3'-cyclic-nucleotide 2'-phosphodiesterase/5'-nucleotidase/3'-nucleotidase, partial [Syntrophus sp. (in: bacteria)]|nr:multifunctional 2',3'-cyclic-nucleotide 2'-phosphodiesterase/5'-nucleotidase/3'-nucleotidase [Syntrophus sp. (in: bacteria)]